MTDGEERWWWDLKAGAAVRDDERGPASHMLGPYPSKEAAEAWQQSRDAREDAWKEADERWEGEDPEAPPT